MRGAAADTDAKAADRHRESEMTAKRALRPRQGILDIAPYVPGKSALADGGPVIKLSSNSELAKRMGDIIDIDTGAIIRGEATLEQVGDSILEIILSVASGEVLSKAEILGQNDFIPWKRGVSL